MKALIQRVTKASVSVPSIVISGASPVKSTSSESKYEIGSQSTQIASIDRGLLVFIGIEKADTTATADRTLQKLLQYRIFSDADNKMNLSLEAIKGQLLLVSQFTLAADTSRGLRPGFSTAQNPEQAKQLYEYMVDQAITHHSATQSGMFGADMQVSLVNDGPVTFMLELD